MTNFLSLVSGSDFSPRLSGGATQCSGGDGAFAGLLGDSPGGVPMQGGKVANISMQTTASMTALVANDVAGPVATIGGIDTAGGETTNLITATVTSDPGTGERIALESKAGDGELITAGDPANTNALGSAASSTLSSSSKEQSGAQSKIAGKTVLIESTDKNLAEGPLMDPSLNVEVAATEGEGEPEQAKDEAQSTSETNKAGRLLKSRPTKSDPSADGLVVSAFPPAVPVAAGKQQQSSHKDGETFEVGEDVSVSENSPGDRAAPKTGHAQAAPRAMAVSAQAATDGMPGEFAPHLASDGGDGTSPIVAGTGAASEHGAPAAIRLPSHTSPTDTVIAARAGQIGKDLAVEIAKHSKDGRDSLTIRLDPAELGRIHVRMHFDDQGSLRAHVTAESHAALEMLRRDSQDLARALGDAGVRTDAQSFRFDGRGQDGSQQGQRHAQAWQQHDAHGHTGEPLPEEPVYRRLRTNGAVDLFA